MKLRISVTLNILFLGAAVIFGIQNTLLRIDRAIADHYFPAKKCSFDALVAGQNGPDQGKKYSDFVFDYRVSPLQQLSIKDRP